MRNKGVNLIDSSVLPTFQDGTVVLDYTSLAYNPCDDLIFPSVIRAEGLLQNALGRYHMYYAPHNAPGGICLAYASYPRGPWVEYAGNPLIGSRWEPHYDVEHVSSPHVVFIPEESRLFLYYHGDNDTTRFATSEDGLSFTYGGVAVHTGHLEGADGTSYARVFRHRIPLYKSRYIMLFLAYQYQPGSWEQCVSHGLHYAWSEDARNWFVASAPIIGHQDVGDAEFVCSPWLLTWKGRYYILYHKDSRDPEVEGNCTAEIYCAEIDADLNRIGKVQLFCARTVFSHDNLRVSDPSILVDGSSFHLYAAIGSRLHQRIGLTTGPTS